jgi:hypothetical protein
VQSWALFGLADVGGGGGKKASLIGHSVDLACLAVVQDIPVPLPDNG